jgi:hypothetical protein
MKIEFLFVKHCYGSLQTFNSRRQSKVTDPIASVRVCGKYSRILTDANFVYYTDKLICESIVEVSLNAKQTLFLGQGVISY